MYLWSEQYGQSLRSINTLELGWSSAGLTTVSVPFIGRTVACISLLVPPALTAVIFKYLAFYVQPWYRVLISLFELLAFYYIKRRTDAFDFTTLLKFLLINSFIWPKVVVCFVGITYFCPDMSSAIRSGR